MIKIIAIMLSLYLCQESFYYQGIYTGFTIGAQMDGIIYPVQGNLYATHGVSPYAELTNIHLYINWFLIFFIFGKLINKSLPSQIISLPSIFLTFFAFIQVYNLKNSYISDQDKYFDVMRITFQSDFVHIWLALVLVIYQIITAIQNCLEWKRNSIKVE